ncbi:UDP-N-acetylmuramoyl-L-alanyl-D-glutamate--2,6-diaminopimelate ligase [Paenibacillus sp. JCM 10914]|uniref:UDP-N-acetylmuramoyl-L-alanyl-D-glutamate--2, 6-diaminopimelate ligase n=1 Tax=Paenibacillus sp. JCM 10914 TaxID=1236974 RepID=UPI0003CC753E|nr:UDP-N-acetylmuramoyl-L-alanyl-D-glutamate--2,6-diaminopimelate ligase [Paenibacillus sp. JCM 10914]GAE05016.1 UDP-N-acetylmuramoylalanyl-D-glutamate-2,6-diaminopimelate ligase [Paenibacillus sp. JCM 10914]
MILKTLTEPLILKTIAGDDTVEITNMDTDSRNILPGGLFVCVPGFHVDGHEYVNHAVQNGAVALVTQHKLSSLPEGVTQVVVPDTRRVLPILANAFYANPSEHLRLIGVTGTNGKTTTTHMIEQILNDAQQKTGVIGTLYMKIGEYMETTANTTPDIVQLQRYFDTMVSHNGQYAVLEVSSHGLDMGRVRGCNFQTVVFTNLSHDHLDFHHDMDAYRNTKELLFSQLGNGPQDMLKKAVLNADDAASIYYAKRTSAQVVTYGIVQEADVRAQNIRHTSGGCQFTVKSPWGESPIKMKVHGTHNVYNALAAMTTCLLEGVTWSEVKASLAQFSGVRGRFQEIDTGRNFQVVVDYAHNPDGLRATLQSAREITNGKIICVIGCRGERDRLKRPIMAGIAATYSDHVLFTTDNPFSEDPEQIISEMLGGLSSFPNCNWEVVPNRKEAIQRAVEMAGHDDRIMITGRGHETRYVTGKQIDIFSDEEIVHRSLKMSEEVGMITLE